MWKFLDEQGNTLERRTQSLRTQLAGTEPFHWSGDMQDLSTLVEEIHGKRMGGAEQTTERIEAFDAWLVAIRPHRPQRQSDDVVERGRAAFVARCASCHGEDGFAGNRAATIDGLSLQVPSLRGVALRAPYMHDGRTYDLHGAVVDMMPLTANPSITDQEIDEIVQFLETL